MKKVALCIAVLGLFACSFVIAQPATPPQGGKVKTEVKKMVQKVVLPKVIGEVTAVDATANTITIKEKSGNEITFGVDSKAKITKGNKPMALADITANMSVKVTYKEENAQKIAVAIQEIKLKKAEKPKGK